VKCVVTFVLVPFLCPSDHWVSCYCLLLQDNKVLTSLNLASNNLGAPLFPAGWTRYPDNSPSYRFRHTDSSHQEAAPEGTSYPGAITIANAIKDMRALTSLNLADNRLCGIWTNGYGIQKGTFDSSGRFSAHVSFNDD
jgi:hypothetical protein